MASANLARRRTELRRWVSLDKTSGALLIMATALALGWANSPWRSSYERLSSYIIGPESFHLDLSLATWAADGLLAIFFFVIGLELKHQLVAGSLRDVRQAAVPVLAAVGGMVLPALIYLGITAASHNGELRDGWAIPTATDIAFALAILAIFGRGLPIALRLFLLTLAVVDDLLAIIVIALFYTESIEWGALAMALVGVALFAVLVRVEHPPVPLLLIVAFSTWALMHESGVHATIAGAMLGFTVPALPRSGEHESRTHTYDYAMRPIAAGLALPIFAFFSAGVNIVDSENLRDVAQEPVVVAIVLALVLGKLMGVLGTTALVTSVTPLKLPDAIGLRDLLPISFLTGIGFTVSLLITELSFEGTTFHDLSKLGVLTGSFIAAALAAITLHWDARRARQRDMNLDGIVDIDIEPIP